MQERFLKHSILLSIIILSVAFLLRSAIAQEEDPYMLFMETEADLTIYSYVDETYVWVYDSADNLIWEGNVNLEEPQVISTPAGTYMCVGSSAEATFGVAPGIYPGEETGDAGVSDLETMSDGKKSGGLQASATLQVICVPWIGDPNLSHDTYNGKQITLQGIARGLQSGVTYTYEWDFDDGSPPATGTVSPTTGTDTDYIIEATHIYSGHPIGTALSPTLTVNGSDSTSASDEFPVTIRDSTLDVKVNIAISEGLWYLHKVMYRWTYNYGAGNVDYGRIPNWTGYYSAYSYQAMEAFQNQGHLVTGDPSEDPYVETVQRGLNWLLRNISTHSVTSKQHAGYAEDYNNNGTPADDGGNGIGLSASSTYMYTYGIALLALASSRAPNQIAAPVNRSYVDGRTYRDIVQDMVDFGVWSQNDYYSWRRGGWRYYSNYSSSDNSVTQWPLLGIFAAEDHPFLVQVPQWAKNETKNYWIPYSQYGDGGFGYHYASYWRNVAKTGAGLILLSWTDFPATDTRVTNAKNFITARWGWTGWGSDYNKGCYYAMYGVMKGARLTDPQIDKFGTVDWYSDYANWLVGQQYTSGSYRGGWPRSYWVNNSYGNSITTAWAILILTPTVFANPPVADLDVSPNPVDTGIDVTFDGTDSYVSPAAPPGTTITEYRFDFGDGSPVYIENASSAPDGAFDGITTHQYASHANYTASLKVIDSQTPPQESAPANIIVNVTPPDHPPTGVIGVLSGALPSVAPGIDYEGFSGVPITFDGSGSYDINEPAGDAITEYAWDVDGSPYTYPILGITTTQTWGAAGTEDVSLRVTDTPGIFFDSPKEGFEFVKVRISTNTKPVADAGPDQILEQTNLAGTPVTLDGSGSFDPDGLPLVSYNWSWAGGTASGVNPTITLPLGSTVVTLIVNDGGLDSDSDTVTITSDWKRKVILSFRATRVHRKETR